MFLCHVSNCFGFISENITQDDMNNYISQYYSEPSSGKKNIDNISILHVFYITEIREMQQKNSCFIIKRLCNGIRTILEPSTGIHTQESNSMTGYAV